MRLHDLHPNKGSRHSKKRIGRGAGSGHGKTSTRGQKGTGARYQVPLGFEGGQTPLHRRLPILRGFRTPYRKVFNIVNLGRLEGFDASQEITPELLLERRIIRKAEDGLKILGDGELKTALTIRAHKFSKTAVEKIQAAGGKAEVI